MNTLCKFAQIFVCTLILATSSSPSLLAEEISTNKVVLTEFKKSTDQSRYAESSSLISTNQIKIVNKTLFEIINLVHPDGGDIVFLDEADLPKEGYDLTLTGKELDYENAWKPLEHALLEKFHVTVTRRKKEMAIYELTVKDSPPKGLIAVKSKEGKQYSGSGLKWEFKSCTMDDLEKKLNDFLPLLVYNETGLEGRYNFVLEAGQFSSTEEVLSALNKIGLEAKKVKREKDAVIVEKAKPKAS